MKVLLISLMLMATVAHAADGKLKAGVFDPPRMAPDFTLESSHGGEVKLSRYRGKVVALGFGFSHCPEICPTTLAMLAKARQRMGAAGKDFQVVYVTVDPERDSPERLRAYLTRFDPSFVGATGTPARLGQVRDAYGIAAARKMGKDAAYGVDHSSFVYLIDREGRLRALAPYGRSADDIAHDVAILLNK
ncbi:MAG TPA: SCO family protein [Usitatibacter sp.]|nr:SCO family protein [Usitatibacter sp.]